MRNFLTCSPEKAKKILRSIFGDTFAKTVLRPTIGAAIGGLILLVLVAILPDGEAFPEMLALSTLVETAALIGAGTIAYANLGFLIGWGVAHWRFRIRPRGIWPYWLGGALSGILAYSGLFAMLFLLTEPGPEVEPVAPRDAIFFVFNFIVASAFMGILASLFFRYALSFSMLARGREED